LIFSLLLFARKAEKKKKKEWGREMARGFSQGRHALVSVVVQHWESSSYYVQLKAALRVSP
jgi:hypothetical protein